VWWLGRWPTRPARRIWRSHGLQALQEAINRFAEETNASPRLFRWTRNPDQIIAAAKRGHQALHSLR
jgi:hypothetical protein